MVPLVCCDADTTNDCDCTHGYWRWQSPTKGSVREQETARPRQISPAGKDSHYLGPHFQWLKWRCGCAHDKSPPCSDRKSASQPKDIFDCAVTGKRRAKERESFPGTRNYAGRERARGIDQFAGTGSRKPTPQHQAPRNRGRDCLQGCERGSWGEWIEQNCCGIHPTSASVLADRFPACRLEHQKS
jgi:hypothetical protein